MATLLREMSPWKVEKITRKITKIRITVGISLIILKNLMKKLLQAMTMYLLRCMVKMESQETYRVFFMIRELLTLEAMEMRALKLGINRDVRKF